MYISDVLYVYDKQGMFAQNVSNTKQCIKRALQYERCSDRPKKGMLGQFGTYPFKQKGYML